MATTDDSGNEGPEDEDRVAADEAADEADDESGRPGRKTHDRLLSRWVALLVSARGGKEGPHDPDPVPYGRNLLSRWSEPQRHYHTVDHLLTVLNRVDELAPHAQHMPHARGAAAADIDAVLLAVWFHDAVYRPDRSENEERSAHLAERALPEAGVSPDRTAEVARLVRLTVSHDPAPDDVNGQLLCDADLAVLAGPPEEYARYAAAVRREYAFVPDDRFRAGRADALRQLLGMPQLFRTPYGQDHWERPARRNLGTEMELLVTGD